MTVVVRFGTLRWSRGLPLDPKVVVAADTTEPLRTDTGIRGNQDRCACRRGSEGNRLRPYGASPVKNPTDHEDPECNHKCGEGGWCATA